MYLIVISVRIVIDMMTINNEKEREMKDKMKTLADSLGLESVVDMATGYGSLSYFMDDKTRPRG